MVSSLVGVWCRSYDDRGPPGSTPLDRNLDQLRRPTLHLACPATPRSRTSSSSRSGAIAAGGGCVARAPDGRGGLRPPLPPRRAGAGPGHLQHDLLPAGRRGRDPDPLPRPGGTALPARRSRAMRRLRLPARGARGAATPQGVPRRRAARAAGRRGARGRGGAGRRRRGRARLAQPGAGRGGRPTARSGSAGTAPTGSSTSTSARSPARRSRPPAPSPPCGPASPSSRS